MTTRLEKTNRYLEIFWLIMSVATAAIAIYTIIAEGWEYGKWYLLFPGLALAMYFFRRGFRKRYERQRMQAEAGSSKA